MSNKEEDYISGRAIPDPMVVIPSSLTPRSAHPNLQNTSVRRESTAFATAAYVVISAGCKSDVPHPPVPDDECSRLARGN